MRRVLLFVVSTIYFVGIVCIGWTSVQILRKCSGFAPFDLVDRGIDIDRFFCLDAMSLWTFIFGTFSGVIGLLLLFLLKRKYGYYFVLVSAFSFFVGFIFFIQHGQPNGWYMVIVAFSLFFPSYFIFEKRRLLGITKE